MKEGKGDAVGGPGAKKFMWLLGDPPKGPHCADCVSRNGQVKTLLEWLGMPSILRKWALQRAAGLAVVYDKALARQAAEDVRLAKAGKRGKG